MLLSAHTQQQRRGPDDPVESVGLVEVLPVEKLALEVEKEGSGANTDIAAKPPLMGSLRMRRTVEWSPLSTSAALVRVGDRHGPLVTMSLLLRLPMEPD